MKLFKKNDHAAKILNFTLLILASFMQEYVLALLALITLLLTVYESKDEK